MKKAKFITFILSPLASVLCGQEANSAEEQELAKSSQNPLGSLVSVPFENTFFFDFGPSESMVFASIAKPVYPIPLGDYNLINRFIVPLFMMRDRMSVTCLFLRGRAPPTLATR